MQIYSQGGSVFGPCEGRYVETPGEGLTVGPGVGANGFGVGTVWL